MNGYNFTDRVRTVLQMAREEAARLRQDHVDTGHILLGIIKEGEGVAAAVLTNLNVDLEAIEEKIEATAAKGNAPAGAQIDLPYASRAKKVLELSMSEAREMDHSYVGTEHLLLGVIREEKGVAAQALASVGITLQVARAETLRLLGTGDLGPARHSVAAERDEAFRTAIALIELHRVRFGAYPDSLDALQFLTGLDRRALVILKYEKLADGYALDAPAPKGGDPGFSYPSAFWNGLGIRRTNVRRSDDG